MRRSTKKTKGQVEAEISNGIIQFEKDYMGRGPTECKTYIIDDVILVRLKGVLTPAEQQLARSGKRTDLIKKLRSNLLELGRDLLSKLVEEITGTRLVSLHTDISTRTGERVIIFTLSENLEKKFRASG